MHFNKKRGPVTSAGQKERTHSLYLLLIYSRSKLFIKFFITSLEKEKNTNLHLYIFFSKIDSSLSLIYDFLFIRKAEGTNVAWGSIYHDPRYIYERRTLIFPDTHTPRYERKKENFDVAGGRPSRRNTEANIRLTFI